MGKKSPYSSAREALNKRIKRLERKGMIFPKDILENKTIEEMNLLRGKALKDIAQDVDVSIKIGIIFKPEDIRTGYSGGTTYEKAKELIEKSRATREWIESMKESESYDSSYTQSNYDTGKNDDIYEESEPEKDLTNGIISDLIQDMFLEDEMPEEEPISGDDLIIENFLNQFTGMGDGGVYRSYAQKLIDLLSEEAGQEDVVDSIFDMYAEGESPDKHAGKYKKSYTPNYLLNLADRVEKKSGGKTRSKSNDIMRIITDVADYMERNAEDWSKPE